MTVDPAENKYIKNYQAIKSIQDHLIDSAKLFNGQDQKKKIQIVNNSNVDKSMVKLHQVILKRIRKMKRKI